nr:sugar carrier protein A-like [Ipomoea trifida]
MTAEHPQPHCRLSTLVVVASDVAGKLNSKSHIADEDRDSAIQREKTRTAVRQPDFPNLRRPCSPVAAAISPATGRPPARQPLPSARRVSNQCRQRSPLFCVHLLLRPPQLSLPPSLLAWLTAVSFSAESTVVAVACSAYRRRFSHRAALIPWTHNLINHNHLQHCFSPHTGAGLINMPRYLFSLSPKAYKSYNTAVTSNFCGYTDSLVLWLFLFMPFGVCCGIFLGQRLRFAWMNLVFGSMLIVSGAIVCTQVSKPVVHAFSYFFLGLGNGFVREVIPALLLQIAPSHETDRLDSIFDFGIGSFLAFAIVCFVTPWVIPRYGRRVVTVVSFTVIGGLQWLLFVASRIAFTTEYHIHEPFNTIAGISVVMIYVMHGAANGPHGLTAMKYPIVADRINASAEQSKNPVSEAKSPSKTPFANSMRH